MLSRVIHLVEVKVLKGKFVGPQQLEQYMKSEHRSTGFLLVLDSNPPANKRSLPQRIETSAGLIQLITIDINPLSPSRMVDDFLVS